MILQAAFAFFGLAVQRQILDLYTLVTAELCLQNQIQFFRKCDFCFPLPCVVLSYCVYIVLLQ